MITEISLLTQLQLENFRNQYQYQNKLPTLVNVKLSQYSGNSFYCPFIFLNL